MEIFINHLSKQDVASRIFIIVIYIKNTIV